MMQLEVAGKRYPVSAGETVIGSAPEAAIPLSGEGVRPRHAVVESTSEGTAAIRPAEPGAHLLINGVRLGSDPTPVLHGDKIQIGEHEILAVDPGRAGSTQLFDSGAFADLVPKMPPKIPAGATGGRRTRYSAQRSARMKAASGNRMFRAGIRMGACAPKTAPNFRGRTKLLRSVVRIVPR